MGDDPAPDLVRWVKEGERLFGLALQALHSGQETGARAERLDEENRRLRQENEALRQQLIELQTERVEVADTLKTFAESVTRMATTGIARLGVRRIGGNPGPDTAGAPTGD